MKTQEQIGRTVSRGRRLAVFFGLMAAFFVMPVLAEQVTYSRTGTIYIDDARPEDYAESWVSSVPKFSEANGTLTGVTLSLNIDFTGGYDFANDSGGAAGQVEHTPHAHAWAETRLPSLSRVTIDKILPAQVQSFAAGAGGTAQDTSMGTGLADNVLPPAEMAEFAGTGAATIDIEIEDLSDYLNQSGTPGAGTFTRLISADFEVSVTYTYTPPAPSSTIRFVNHAATGGNDGTSWADAHTDFMDAIAAANPGDEIWVAAGTYHPAAPNGDREASFTMKPGVSWFGGFAGGETDRATRDPVANPTILSGDLNDDDGGGTGVNARWYHMGENSYHVVRADNLLLPATIDGFTIRRGWAWQSSGGNSAGSGMTAAYCDDVTIANCRFEMNLAHSGAGLLTIVSNATVEGCTFFDNLASDGRGGAIYHASDWQDGASTYLLTITDTTFTSNTATVGANSGAAGAIWSDFRAPVRIDGCLFENNEARWRFSYGSFSAGGGAMLIFGENSRITNSVFRSNRAHVGGALWIGRNITIANCLFVSNEAFRVSAGYYDYGGYAGAIYAPGTGTNNNTVIEHCTFHANTARNVGGIWANAGVTISNSILYTNTSTEVEATPLDEQLSGDPVIRHSCIKGLPDPQDGTITFNPVFVDENGADNILGNADDDLRLSDGSPCIDSGDNGAFPAWAAPFDLAGENRFIDDPATPDTGAGLPPLTDMGAFEFVPGTVPPGPPNIKPVASFTSSVDGNTVTFTSTSTDSDGTIVDWIWDFGDGSSGIGPNAVHTYLANGSYDVTLTVRDDRNGTNRSPAQAIVIAGLLTHSVFISSPANGETVSGVVPIVTLNTPDTTRVKLYIDGVYTGIKVSTETEPYNPPFPTSYTVYWDTTDSDPLIGVADGVHVIQLKANDEPPGEDETEYWSQEVTVIVQNAPPPAPVEGWREQHFSAADLADPSKEATVWGGEADPDGDGLSNDGEFGLGTNPSSARDGDGGLTFGVVFEDGQALLTMTYRSRNDDPELSIVPELSDDFTMWSSGPGMLLVTSAIDQGDGYDAVTVKEVPAAEPRIGCFGRVSVNRAAP